MARTPFTTTIEEKNDVAVIDTKTLTIKGRWPVAPAGAPWLGIWTVSTGGYLRAAAIRNSWVMMDADSGRVLQSLPISSGADANVFESETGLLFVSTRAGKLHIFHEDSPDKVSEVETVETEFGAKTMNIDPKTHNFFLTTADFGSPGPPTKKHPHRQRVPIPGAFSRVDLWALEKSSRRQRP